MIINNIKFGSHLIQSNLNKKFLQKNLININKFKLRNDSSNVNVINASNGKRKSKKFKYFLVFCTIPSISFLAYYQYYLNEQEKRKIRVNISSLYRAARSFKVGLYIATDYKWNLWGLHEDSEEYAKAIKGCHLRAAQRMVKACIANGGLYVKLGQGLSTMNQILPEEYYLTLRTLQNQALRSEGTDINQLFCEEFNKMPLEIFKEFDYNPIAAASLAQVHKAVDQNDQPCAVKLQYIDLQDRFHGDIFTCRVLLKLIAWSFPSFSFSWVLEELKGTLEKELDFLNEASNAERCFKELKHLNYIYVPKIYYDKSTKKVLTMEFIDGVKISDVEGIKQLGLDLKDVDKKLVNAFAQQVFHSGFVHADPHHANVFVRKLNNSNEAEIVLLDHGLYEYINEDDRRNLCKLWKSIILKNEEMMKFYTTKLNVKEENYLPFAAFLMMRPLHRPVHQKFIFNNDWIRMSEKEKLKAIDEGKIKIPTHDEYKKMSSEEIKNLRQEVKPYFEEIKQSILALLRQMPYSLLLVCSEMLIMQPLRLRTTNFQFKLKLDDDEVIKMRDEIRTNFAKIQAVLRQVPLPLVLIFRNLNTIRAIIHDHGNLIDRHTLMARSAIYGSYKDQLKMGITQKLRAWFELKFFDFVLLYDRLARFIGTIYFNYFMKNNKISSEIYNEINKSMQNV